MNTKAAILTAIGGMIALAGPLAFAADDGKDGKAMTATEKCYGVVRAGKNDCAGAAHSCQGQSKKDADAKEWVKVPTGTCERLVGGMLTTAKK